MATQNRHNLDYAGNCARKPPSLAVALNCGTGSSFLKALVKALDRLHMVRAENCGYCGLEVEPVDLGQEAPGGNGIHTGWQLRPGFGIIGT